jgi:hypothetical protein
MSVEAKLKRLGLMTLIFASFSSPAWSGEILISHASLQRAGVPGTIHLPMGGVVDTRAIRQQLYGKDFHPGDTVAWDTETSNYVIHKRLSPSQVSAKRVSRTRANENVASIAPGRSWFSVGATKAQLDEEGAVVFIGRFSPNGLAPRNIDETSSSVFKGNKVSYSIQKSADFTGFSTTNSVCVPGPPPIDTDGDGIPDSTDPDDDNDGMPDEYENAHSVLDPLNRFDAGLDPDRDGLTSLQEYNISPLMNPDNPDTDFDGIQDNIDDDPPFYSNICSGFEALLVDETIIDRRQCAAAVSVTISGTVTVEPGGDLEVISSSVIIDPVFNANGVLTIISADPCPACPPLF